MRRLTTFLFNISSRPQGHRLQLPSLPPASSPTLRCPFRSFRNLHRLCAYPSPSKFGSPFAFSLPIRPLSTADSSRGAEEKPFQDEMDKEEAIIDEWEEEDDAEPQIGDGGDGGGIVLQNVPWGERVLSIAREVLQEFGDDMELYAFKTSPRGYIYVRLDKISNKFGCPSMEEIESYSRQYNKRLEEEGSKGEIPNDLALEVSSSGAERILRVPDDLHRFRDFPMVVSFVEEDVGATKTQKSGVFLLDSIDTDSESCVWKLADVRENRDPSSKGRPLSRKQKDWRLKLPYQNLKKVMLYLGLSE